MSQRQNQQVWAFEPLKDLWHWFNYAVRSQLKVMQVGESLKL